MAIKLDELFVSVGADLSKFQSAMGKLESRVQNVRQSLDNLAGGAAKLGAPLAAGAGLVVKTLYNFDAAMNQVQATLGVTGEEMEGLRDQAKLLGRTTEFSASQAAEAQTQLAQAGFDANQILEATPDVLALASAGQLSMAESAKLTANQLRAFGLDVSEAGRVTDVLAAAAASSNTSVRELGPAFRQVAPIANKAGLSIEETAGYLGVLRDNGFAAEQAGTAMRAVLSRLVAPAGEAKDILEEIGLPPDFVKNKIEAGEFQDVLESLRTRGLTLQQAMKLFGQEAGAAGLVLLDGAANARELAKEYENAGGRAQEMADIQNQGLVGAFRNMKSAAEGLQIAIGESGLGKAAENFFNVLTDLMNRITESSDEFKTMIGTVLTAGPALLGAALGLKGLSFALGALGPVMKAVRVGFILLRSIFALSPFGLLITAITGIIVFWDDLMAVMERAGANFEGLKAVWDASIGSFDVSGLLGQLGDVADAILAWDFAAAGDAINNIVIGFKSWAAGVTEGAGTALQEAFGNIDYAGLAGSIGTGIAGAVVSFAGWATNLLQSMTDAVAGIDFAGIGEAIGTAVRNAIGFAISTGGALLSGIFTSDNATEATSAGTDLATAVIDAIKTVISSSASLVAGVFSGLFDGVGNLDFAGTAQSISTGIVGALAGVTFNLVTWAGNFLDSAATAIAGVNWFQVANTAVTGLLAAAVGALDLAEFALSFVQNLLTALGDVDFVAVGQAVGSAVRAAIVLAFNALTGLGNLILGLFSGDEGELGASFGALAGRIVTLLATGIETAILGIGGLIAGLVLGLFDIDLGAKGTALIETLKTGIIAAKDRIVEAIKSALGPVGRFLPGSDAEEGPLSRLTASGRSILETIAEGVRQAPPLTAVLENGLQLDPVRAIMDSIPDLPQLEAVLENGPSLPQAPPAAVTALAGGPAPAAGGGVNLNVTIGEGAIQINAQGGNADEIAAKLGTALSEQGDQWRALAEQLDSSVMA